MKDIRPLIEENIQEELRLLYNPEGSELRKKQLELLKMLKYIDSICRSQNIKYWLSSGTCLGAIRHGGFIPWDDDVDIELLEDDYNKLVDYLQRHPNSKYVIQTPDNDPNYIMDFAKLRDRSSVVKECFGIDKDYKYRGLFIDIFKVSSSNSQFLHYACGRLRVLEVHCKLKAQRSSIYKIMFPLVRNVNNLIIGFCKPLDRIGAKEKLRHTLGVPFLKLRYYKDVENTKQVVFEDQLFPVPANYDSYLSHIYGNYKIVVKDHCHFE